MIRAIAITRQLYDCIPVENRKLKRTYKDFSGQLPTLCIIYTYFPKSKVILSYICKLWGILTPVLELFCREGFESGKAILS